MKRRYNEYEDDTTNEDSQHRYPPSKLNNREKNTISRRRCENRSTLKELLKLKNTTPPHPNPLTRSMTNGAISSSSSSGLINRHSTPNTLWTVQPHKFACIENESDRRWALNISEEVFEIVKELDKPSDIKVAREQTSVNIKFIWKPSIPHERIDRYKMSIMGENQGRRLELFSRIIECNFFDAPLERHQTNGSSSNSNNNNKDEYSGAFRQSILSMSIPLLGDTDHHVSSAILEGIQARRRTIDTKRQRKSPLVD